MYKPLVLLGCLALSGLAAAVESLVPGYNIVDLEWDVETSPGGPVVRMNGTVQKIHEELLKINPDYDTQFGGIHERDSEKRAIWFSSVSCSDRWSWCSAGAIDAGIRYLRGVRGEPVNGPGPGNCARVSCSDNAGIWWCNDNPVQFGIGGFGAIADGAEVIANACVSHSNGVGAIRGQAFHQDNWNVIISNIKC